MRSYLNFLDARVSLSNCPSGIDIRSNATDAPALRGFSSISRTSVPEETVWGKANRTALWRRRHGSFEVREFAPDCVFTPDAVEYVTISVVTPSSKKFTKFKLLSITTC